METLATGFYDGPTLAVKAAVQFTLYGATVQVRCHLSLPPSPS
jgi:hypothetical protein